MSLRRFLAGPVSFGLTLGLAIVALMLESWQIDPFPVLTLVAWGTALVLTAITLKLGWPIFHVGAAGALMVAAVPLVDTAYWALPLVAAVGAMAMARFASVGFVSRWLGRTVGVGAIVGLGWVVWFAVQDVDAWSFSVLETIGAVLALGVIAALGFWHPDDEDEEA